MAVSDLDEKRPSSINQTVPLHSIIVALVAFLTVVDLFAAQALLPSLIALYDTTPAAMGVAVNACTLGMAAGGMTVALYGQRVSRRIGVTACLACLTLPTLGLALAPNLAVFAMLRVVQGLFMSAAFGLTLAHIGESSPRDTLPTAFAAYITGNVASNLGGRLLAAAAVDHASVASSFIVFAGLNLFGAILAAIVIRGSASMPASSRINQAARLAPVLKSPQLRAAFGIGFVILFVFIGVFTYINIVLVRPPLGLGMMQLGFVYFVFLPAIFTTPIAGVVARKIGTRAAIAAGLGIALIGLPFLAASHISYVAFGMVLVGIGTFFAQAIVTGYASRIAGDNAAAATGVYLASYFSGGLAGAAVLGQIFDRVGWNGCLSAIGLALALAIGLTAKLTDAHDLKASS
ncbi:MAG: hypothetical protein B7Y80_11580 [Hyphomicrobium sp. 32-62-53]|nr:MAG: hypothetical protein B7Z29_01335 [Hyphomicrobium sp. 12-62-95]OYX99154.1 MAG: hypothetical protein B7Y80_11580 [Hyphomicrobium sp. 32-62-53]